MVDNTSTHMEVYTEMMPGPKDNILPWPMRGKFTVKLLNQLRDGDTTRGHGCTIVPLCLALLPGCVKVTGGTAGEHRVSYH